MPSSTLVTIAYSIPSAKQEQFTAIMRDLVQKINTQGGGVNLSLYKSDTEDNSYVEVYECDSIDSYDALEDNLDDASRESIARIAAEFATARQVVTTMKQIL